jgi:7-cyano-7-deazaguanine synthase
MSAIPDAGRRALVLFSGGQDSTTCLAWALERFALVETVGFDYGQRHRVEMDIRLEALAEIRLAFPDWRVRLADDHVVDLAVLGEISETALTRDVAMTYEANGLPNTFVPGRNILFLAFAATIAYRRGLGVLVGGMCETDFSGYPDCRDKTIKAMQLALSLGLDRELLIETPLMWIDKADTWALAHLLGGELLTRLIIRHTHTCYNGVRETLHVWGYGCGECPACLLRKAGFEKWALR